MSTPDGMHTDHVNGNGLDNRRCNLRICSNSQNHMNRRKMPGKSSVYKGVCAKPGKWESAIRVKRKLIHIGYFKNECDAAKAYDKSARKYFGEFARPNFIEPVEEGENG
jgi:hypothetical protein